MMPGSDGQQQLNEVNYESVEVVCRQHECKAGLPAGSDAMSPRERLAQRWPRPKRGSLCSPG